MACRAGARPRSLGRGATTPSRFDRRGDARAAARRRRRVARATRDNARPVRLPRRRGARPPARGPRCIRRRARDRRPRRDAATRRCPGECDG